jgi:Tol biopolymer transport system component/predicted Ser/Thr protein kinase
MTLSSGARLGPYEIVAPLGSGGMGEVYKARDTRLDRTVAIKVLPPHVASDPSFRQRFEREAKTISSLDHPHICALYDVGQHQGTDFLVMQYLEGETLADRLAKGPVPLDQALKHAMEIADALDKAHRQGIVHRDLKPGNVMLTKSGAKLLDFGLAKLIAVGTGLARPDVTATGPMTAEGTILGTLQYMAPEQLEGKEADARSDIWALGCVIYEMVTGRRAFTGDSQATLIAAILDHDPPPLATKQPLVPRALDHIVRRCLAKDPDQRWQSARDLFLELKWVAEGGSAREAGGAAQRSRTRERALAAALAVALAAAAAVSALYVSSGSQPSPDRPGAHVDIPLSGTLFENWIDSPAISPDGRHVAFTGSGDGPRQLWIRALDNRALTAVSGTLGASAPFWSHDSQSIGFFAEGQIKRIAVDGGSAVTVCGCDFAYGAAAAWNRDGVILYAHPAGGIYQVSQGGTPQKVTTLRPGEREHGVPAFLPDGRRFVYIASGARNSVYAGSLDGSDPVRIVDDASMVAFADPGYLLFTRGSTLLAQGFDPETLQLRDVPVPVIEDILWDRFSVSRNGVLAYRPASVIALSQVTWIGRDGKRLGVVGELGRYLQMRLSPSGRKLAMVRREQGRNQDLWLLDLTTSVFSRLTSDPGHDSDPAWSPDERRIAFTGERGGVQGVWLKDLTTGREERLPADPKPTAYVDDWSPDGRFVIFRQSGHDAIYSLSMDGTPAVRTIGETSNPDQSHVSPDGRWIAFQAEDSGRNEVYVATFPDFTHKRQVSNAGGVQPLWRSDGGEVYYLDLEGRLMVVPFATEPALGGGTPAVLFPTGIRPAPVDQYAVARGGEKFLILEPGRAGGELLTLLLDWPARLRRR